MQSGWLGVIALVFVLLSVLFVGIILYRLGRHRRFSWGLSAAVCAMLLYTYVVWDWYHLYLTFAMQDAPSVRIAGDALLAKRPDVVPEDQTWYVPEAEWPEAFRRLGVRSLAVTPQHVRISLLEPNGLTGTEWGFLYDPNGVEAPAYLWGVRPMIYEDFKEYHLPGE